MESLPIAYFDALYDRDPDPWGFETSDFERGKYHATLAALPRPRYRFGLEVGCSIGVLTAELAQRCDRLLGIDVAEAPLARARVRLQHQPNVRFACRAFPGEVQSETPQDGFDLIMLSEVLYYIDPAALARAARVTRAVAAAGADILLVHGLGPTPEYPLTGDAAAESFIAAMGGTMTLAYQAREPGYRIDLLRA